MSAEIRAQYLEAIRLYLWYSPSEFSEFQSHKSKSQAETYRKLASHLWEKYLKPKDKEKEKE